jgi:two-component system sensor histidine kinase YesM
MMGRWTVKKTYSIRSILIIGFLAVMVPMLLFMLINHFYARDIVREKVTETYRNTLDIFVGQADTNLEEITNYLIKMSIMDVDVGMLMSFPMDNDMYTLTKIRIDTKLKRDVDVYNVIDSVFLFHEGDTILGTNSDYNRTRDIITTHMRDRLNSVEKPADVNRQWDVRYDQRMEGSFFLMNSVEVRNGLYAGAIIRIQDINAMLSRQWSDGDIGYTGILLRDDDHLKELLTDDMPQLGEESNLITNNPYIQGTDAETGQSYLVMSRPSRAVNIAYQVMVPEQALLKELIFFRNVALFAPIGLFLLLTLYMLLLRNMLFKPFHELILGMKKISLGMLDVRLKRGKTIEFQFLGDTFNMMAEQIKTLKIDVYEEQLRVKQGELRQLQAQINPHFYMNSLNIIYNLAALKDTESVKRMSLHLADYFRFIMKVNSDTITLGEELSHIDNYITIQKMRFPDRLDCKIEVTEQLRSFPVAALTIQPFVENAIIHGFKNRRKLFVIVISASKEQTADGRQILKAVVSDNGTGFDEEVLEGLQRKQFVSQSGSNSTGLGIMNVMDRLTLLYGQAATVRFRNKSNESGEGGAEVTITIPETREGERKDV